MSDSSTDTALAVSPTSVPRKPRKAQAPKPAFAIGDVVRMTSGRYAGQSGWVMHTGLRPVTDWAGAIHKPAPGTLSVYLFRLDREIVTLVTHLRRQGRKAA